MNIKFFKDEVELEQALTTAGDQVIQNIDPVNCFRITRETMEELAYRTAVTYTDNDDASLYYWTTLKGICCREVSKRDHGLVGLPVSS